MYNDCKNNCLYPNDANLAFATVMAKVIDIEDGKGIEGVHVIIEGSNPIIGTTTDANGNFQMNMLPNSNLKFTHVSYEDYVLPSSQVDSTVELFPAVNELDEVPLEYIKPKTNWLKWAAIGIGSFLVIKSMSKDDKKKPVKASV